MPTGTKTRKPRHINAAYLKKAPSEVHEGFAAYIEATTGQTVAADTVGLVQRLYPLYLKSPAVVEARERAKAEKEAEEARKRADRARRAKEKLLKVEAQRQKLLAELGLEDSDPNAEVIEAADRFQQPEPDPEVEADLAAVEDNEDEPESDEEDSAEEVTLEDDDEDDWDDDEDEAEDF